VLGFLRHGKQARIGKSLVDVTLDNIKKLSEVSLRYAG